MRGYPKALSVFACAAILMSQVAGLHLHASPNPDNMGLHAAHVHDADLDGHDHSADVDVSVVELSPLWAKLAPMLLMLSLLAVLPVLGMSRFGRRPGGSGSAPRSPTRWRPPLRAPPLRT
jgi:hypothetical protein